MLDPVALAVEVGMSTPDEWQVRALRSTANRSLWNVSRQCGKSSTAAVLALHAALYEPESLTLMLSPSQRQSGELFRKARSMYGVLGRPVEAESETSLTLTLANGSRIVSLPGTESTIRSYSAVRRLIVDEASRVPDDVYFAVVPMLAVSDGDLLALSTPWGRGGWWADAWHDKSQRWERVEVPASECPRISAEFLAEQRRVMGAYFFEQEFECRFLDSDSRAFYSDDVLAAVDNDREAWDIKWLTCPGSMVGGLMLVSIP
jgi:hypothetical protein